MEIIREIIFYKHYFEEFFEPLAERIMKAYFEEQKNKDNGTKK